MSKTAINKSDVWEMFSGGGAFTCLNYVIGESDHARTVDAKALVARAALDLEQGRDGLLRRHQSHVQVVGSRTYIRQSRYFVEVGGEKSKTFFLHGKISGEIINCVKVQYKKMPKCFLVLYRRNS